MNVAGFRLAVADWSENVREMVRRLLRKPCDPVLVIKRETGAGYRRVLVAVDCSSTSVACIEQARALAPVADMVVVHALEDAPSNHVLHGNMSDEQLQELRVQHHEQAYDRLNLLLAGAGIAPHEVVKVVENGYAPALILDAEKKFHIDLLVVGRSSASLLRRFFFRAVAPQVLARARCDVLVVPAVQPPNY